MNFKNYDVFMYIKIVFMPPPFISPLSVLLVCPVCPVMYKNSFNGRFPTMYLSYSYNLIATHKILRTPYLGAPLLGG